MATLIAHAWGCADAVVELTALHLSPSPGAVQLGALSVGERREVSVRVVNDGRAPVTLGAISTSGVDLVRGGERGVLAVGEVREVALAVRVTAAEAATGVLVVESDAPTVEVTVRWSGLEVPSCDDGESCTDERFDPASGRCVSSPREGACDDGDGCTVDDVCAAGRCVGALRSCDDGEVCTTDRCIAGACEHVAAPDGTRCADADLCTVEDVCGGGRCAGHRTQALPALRSTLETHGGQWSRRVLLGDDRVVMADELGSPTPRLTVLALDASGRPQVVATATASAWGPVAAAVGERELVVLGPVIRRYEVAGDGAVRELSTLDGGRLPEHVRDVIALDGAVYVCAAEGLAILDASHPVDLGVARAAEGECASLALDAAGRVLVVGQAAGYQVFDVREPLAPRLVRASSRPGWTVAVRGPVVAALGGDGLSLVRWAEDLPVGRVEAGPTAAPFFDEGERLGVAEGDAITLYDVATPSSPMPVARLPYGTSPLGRHERVQVSARILLTAEAGGFTRDASGAWVAWPTIELGSVGPLAVSGDRVFAYGASHLRELAVEADGRARWVGGGLRAVMSTAWLELPGDERRPPEYAAWEDSIYTVRRHRPFFPGSPTPVFDVGADDARPAGEISGSGGGLSTSHGALRFVLVDGVTSLSLVVYEVGRGARGALTPLSITPIPVPSSSAGWPSVLDTDGQRLVVRVAVERLNLLVVFDVRDPSAPRELARLELPYDTRGLPRDVAIRGDRLFYLEELLRIEVQPFSGRTLHVARLTVDEVGRGRITDELALPMPESNDILRVDGEQVLVSDARGLSFVRLGPAGTATIAHHLDMRGDLKSAVGYRDQLILSAHTGVAVVSPPCLPP